MPMHFDLREMSGREGPLVADIIRYILTRIGTLLVLLILVYAALASTAQ
jgi:hypothetical protein